MREEEPKPSTDETADERDRPGPHKFFVKVDEMSVREIVDRLMADLAKRR